MKKSKIEIFWENFKIRNPEFVNIKTPRADHFCNNKKDADELAELVVKSIKQATCGALLTYKNENVDIAKVDDIWIVTDYEGNPKCVTKTTKVTIVKFEDITAEMAKKEGEGDKSLKYWKKVHWDYYSREMKPYNEKPTNDMIILCEYFKTVWI